MTNHTSLTTRMLDKHPDVAHIEHPAETLVKRDELLVLAQHAEAVHDASRRWVDRREDFADLYDFDEPSDGGRQRRNVERAARDRAQAAPVIQDNSAGSSIRSTVPASSRVAPARPGAAASNGSRRR